MKRLCLAMTRFTLCAWIGAAALFVVAGIREVTSPLLDSTVKDILVPIRFNAYYLFGFVLVAIAMLCSWGARNHPAVAGWRIRTSLTFLLTALVLMLVDYYFIYSPLLEMITPPGQARAATFQSYHQWSERINGIDVGLCAIAAILLVWPRSARNTAVESADSAP